MYCAKGTIEGKNSPRFCWRWHNHSALQQRTNEHCAQNGVALKFWDITAGINPPKKPHPTPSCWCHLFQMLPGQLCKYQFLSRTLLKRHCLSLALSYRQFVVLLENEEVNLLPIRGSDFFFLHKINCSALPGVKSCLFSGLNKRRNSHLCWNLATIKHIEDKLQAVKVNLGVLCCDPLPQKHCTIQQTSCRHHLHFPAWLLKGLFKELTKRKAKRKRQYLPSLTGHFFLICTRTPPLPQRQKAPILLPARWKCRRCSALPRHWPLCSPPLGSRCLSTTSLSSCAACPPLAAGGLLWWSCLCTESLKRARGTHITRAVC